MSRFAKAVPTLVVAVAAFVGGMLWNQSRARSHGENHRRILYYHDPMHPAYKSDKPGIAPDCGMDLVAVYEGESGGEAERAAPAPGTVQVSAEKQQLIGIRTEEVATAAGVRTLRLNGRVVADETRLYRLIAGLDARVREIYPVTTGSLVRKDQPLMTFYSSEFLQPEQAYLYALGVLDRSPAAVKEPTRALTSKANLQSALDALRNLGMSEMQIEDLKASRRLTLDILLRSPATGFVLSRNVFPDERIEKNQELYRIADLRHVWVLADAFENDTRFLGSARAARVHYQGRTIAARVSPVPPIFDASTRALKVRLELDNPDYLLRPDMFVDVDLQADTPAGISVPVDAIVDSGLHKTVFVDRGNGYFEPREVETGARIGNRLIVTSGLEEGERIVVSGNFLIDSESRFQLAAAGLTESAAKDPVCGMDVEPSKTPHKSEYQGRTYHFCSEGCKKKFDANPKKYTAPAKADEKTTARLNAEQG